MNHTNAMAITAAGLALLFSGAQASAGDYYDACKTDDPRFEINDGALYAKSDPNQSEIAYETLDKTTTSERRGYCVARGKRFKFEGRESTQRIRFNYRGSTIETIANCEYASSGLPAAFNCEREVVTFESGSGGNGTGSGSGSAGATLWNHNGSVMRLEADGNMRSFVYDEPRPGMVRQGARPGDVVFEGERSGMTYSGTAYIYSKRCGRVPYPVSGNVAADQQAVLLEGQAPRLNRNCQVNSYRRDRLSFELIGR
ncbi:MAG: hypothetical protein K0U74_07760 [Alphaproteobacteria bacterium]|nr:hypothetical protein [Alphaproteobacteria bacterium]